MTVLYDHCYYLLQALVIVELEYFITMNNGFDLYIHFLHFILMVVELSF